jgi:anaerobic carbon-monoxide dehydrogenase iron sulfur subunit
VKAFVMNPQKCTGCHLCEMACSFHHHGTFSLENANIKVGSDEDRGFHVPTKCMQCEIAYCIKSCVAGALHKDEKTGAVLVDRNKCIGCKACIMACPFGSITLVRKEVALEIHLCNLCEGDPECVKVCRDKALVYVDEKQINREKREKTRYRMSEEEDH